MGSLAGSTGSLCRHDGYTGQVRGMGQHHAPVDIPVGDRGFNGCFSYQRHFGVFGSHNKSGL